MGVRGTSSPVAVLGNRSQVGAYLLRIRVDRYIAMGFGRFKGGGLIPVPAGEYIYVGSARGRRGATSLAYRVLRHARRTGRRPDHPIGAALLTAFRRVGLGPDELRRSEGKKLFWHVDFLLDHEAAVLTHALVIRSEAHLETSLARQLAGDPHMEALEAGLGASDSPGDTHLLRVINADDGWWDDWIARIAYQLANGVYGESVGER